MTRHATTLLERLGLPYRVKLLAAGDTGFASAKTYDLETYAPGVGKWLEVSSSSTFTDFQARRANIRYRPAAGEKPQVRAHAECVGARVSAHHRHGHRALPAVRRQHHRARGAAAVSRHRHHPLSRAPRRVGLRRRRWSHLCSSGRTSCTPSASSGSCVAKRSGPRACTPESTRRWHRRPRTRRRCCWTSRGEIRDRGCR